MTSYISTSRDSYSNEEDYFKALDQKFAKYGYDYNLYLDEQFAELKKRSDILRVDLELRKKAVTALNTKKENLS